MSLVNGSFKVSATSTKDGSSKSSAKNVCSGSKQQNKYTDPEILRCYEASFHHFRYHLSNVILRRIKEDLIAGEPTDDPSVKSFQSEELDFGELREKHMFEIAELVPKDRAERVFCKWLGKSLQDRKVSCETLYQLRLSGGYEVDLKEFDYPLAIQQYWNLDLEIRKATLTISDAREVCKDWPSEPPRLRWNSEACEGLPTVEELSFAAKKLLDVFEASLQPGESLWPYPVTCNEFSCSFIRADREYPEPSGVISSITE